METIKNQYLTENEENAVKCVSSDAYTDKNRITRRQSSNELVKDCNRNKLNIEQKKEIAKSLIHWLEDYERHIIHNRILSKFTSLKESNKDDNLLYLLVSEKLSEELNNMTFTNRILEKTTRMILDVKFIERIRNYDRSKKILKGKMHIDEIFEPFETLWLKPPKTFKEMEEHNLLYNLLVDLNEWINSKDFIDSFSTEKQIKIKRKYNVMKEEISRCFNIKICALYRYVNDYDSAKHFLKEVFSDDQELLYQELKKWIDSEISDSECQFWMDSYLKRSIKMEFKDNPLLRYHKDIEKAKPFMLSQYKKNCELEERQEEELLAELFGDDEDFEYLSYELYEKKRKKNINWDDYSNSYAKREMGYTDDEIDTIFDGDPGAYWNID